MTPRTRAIVTITLTAIGVLALIAAIIYAVTSHGRGSDDQPTDASQSTAAASSDDSLDPVADEQSTAPPTEYPAETDEDDADAPATVLAAQRFLPAYTNAKGDDKAWIKGLASLTTPDMLVSVRTSDRAAAKLLAGATLETSGQDLLVVKDGKTVAALELTQMPTDSDEGGDPEDAPWVISGIDFADPPKDTALPLPRNASQALGTTVQPAVTALLAQPAGLSDKDRTAQVKSAFTDPKHAVKTKRAAGTKDRVVTGNVQDAQITVHDDKSLDVTSTMPWKVDGTDKVQWATYTIQVSRAKDGSWTATDAQ